MDLRWLSDPEAANVERRNDRADKIPAYPITYGMLEEHCPYELPEELFEGKMTIVREEIEGILMVAHDKFLSQCEQKNITTMKQCLDQKQMYTIRHQVEAMGCVKVEWLNMVKRWMEELKEAVQASKVESTEIRTVGNPLMSLLNDFEFYEPTHPAVQSPIIEEIREERGDKEEEEKKGDESKEMDEDIEVVEPEAIVAERAEASRRDKEKAIMIEEDVPAETRLEKEPIYFKELDTAIPADELQFNLSQTFEKKKSGVRREAKDDLDDILIGEDEEARGERNWYDDYFENVMIVEEQGGSPATEGETPMESGNGNAGAEERPEEEAEQKEVKHRRRWNNQDHPKSQQHPPGLTMHGIRNQ